MRIALDYDDTFTRDPNLWTEFVKNCWSRGHEVRIVTFRFERHDNPDLWKCLADHGLRGQLPVMFTNSIRKRQFCNAMGYFPDVWIDDIPELIVAENTYIPGELLARQVGNEDGTI